MEIVKQSSSINLQCLASAIASSAIYECPFATCICRSLRHYSVFQLISSCTVTTLSNSLCLNVRGATF